MGDSGQAAGFYGALSARSKPSADASSAASRGFVAIQPLPDSHSK
jgi:hypothetical protein